MPDPSGIPAYATPFLDEDGKTVNQKWYRFLRTIGNNALGAVVLFQGPLADRPDAAEFADGSVLFIDTDTGIVYYVEGAAWQQGFNFLGYNSGTQKVTVPADFEVGDDLNVIGDSAIGGNETVTGSLGANVISSATVIGGATAVVSGLGQFGSLQAVTTLDVGTDVTVGGDLDAAGTIHADIDITATGDIHATGLITATTTITAGTSLVSAGSTIAGTFFQSGASAGQSNTVPLAKLTGGGANGSITFLGGIETGHTDPT